MRQAAAVADGDDDAVRDERITVELRRRAVLARVVAPELAAVVTVERNEGSGAGAEQQEVSRDRGGRVDSAAGVEDPEDRIILARRLGRRQKPGCSEQDEQQERGDPAWCSEVHFVNLSSGYS